MASSNVKILSADNWSEVIGAERPVLVDFWATWCGPCKQLGPVIDDLAGEFEGRIEVGKVDVDQNPELAGTFGVQSIPTLLLFTGGKPSRIGVGFVPKNKLRDLLERAIAVPGKA